MEIISDTDSPFFKGRFKFLEYTLKQISFLGFVFEFGVYKGESINFIAQKIHPHVVFGFDSFKGLPAPFKDHKKGHFALKKPISLEKNVVLIEGSFEDTLDEFISPNEHLDCSFIHIDCDLYSSTRYILDALKAHILPGTIIIFDEIYNHPVYLDNEGRAWREFVFKNRIYYSMIASTKHRKAFKILGN